MSAHRAEADISRSNATAGRWRGERRMGDRRAWSAQARAAVSVASCRRSSRGRMRYSSMPGTIRKGMAPAQTWASRKLIVEGRAGADGAQEAVSVILGAMRREKFSDFKAAKEGDPAGRCAFLIFCL